MEWTIGGGKMSDTKLETINVLANVLSAIKIVSYLIEMLKMI